MSEPQAIVIRHENPEELTRAKTIIQYVAADYMRVSVQVIKEGGENSLHLHKTADGLWFVLAGEVKFYTTGDELVCKLKAGESVFIPRSFPYWFESSSDEVLELMHVANGDRSKGKSEEDRTELAPLDRQISESLNAHIDA